MVGRDPRGTPGQEAPTLLCSAPAVRCGASLPRPPLLPPAVPPVTVGTGEPGPGWDQRQSLDRNAAGKATHSQRLTERMSWLVKEV